jgi:hypothetical protein
MCSSRWMPSWWMKVKTARTVEETHATSVSTHAQPAQQQHTVLMHWSGRVLRVVGL